MRVLTFTLILLSLLCSFGQAETPINNTPASPVPVSSPHSVEEKKLKKAWRRYFANINKRLKNNEWEYKRPKVKMSFNMHVLPDGSVTEVKIINSSGEQDIDDYALKYAKSLCPLPPLPKAYAGTSIDMEIIEEPW